MIDTPASGLEIEIWTEGTGLELARLAAAEAACFGDPWQIDDLAPLFAAGAAFAVFGRQPGAGEAVAYAIFQLLPGESELLRIGVLPAQRRAGTATELLRRALGELAAGGRPVCHLEVRAHNRPALLLYERLGFTPVARRRSYYADGEDALRYVRNALG